MDQVMCVVCILRIEWRQAIEVYREWDLIQFAFQSNKLSNYKIEKKSWTPLKKNSFIFFLKKKAASSLINVKT